MSVARVEPTIKEAAEVLAAAVEMGAATPGEVVAWADLVILNTDEPDLAVCEVALMRKEPRSNIASTLRQVEGSADLGVVRGVLIERLSEAHDEGLLTAERLAKWMYDDALRDGEGWSEHYGEALFYWDALDLARAGYGDYDAKIRAMKMFLRVVAVALLGGESA